jgi:MOSC domain-containing protein YiiM
MKPARGGTRAAESLNLIAGEGIEGDFYKGSYDRQVLLLDASTLADFGYEPGDLREQILVDLPGLQSLEPGSRLAIGEAEVTITMDCAPCLHMANTLGADGEAFVRKLLGRRGMLGVVVASGRIEAGDPVGVRSAVGE